MSALRYVGVLHDIGNVFEVRSVTVESFGPCAMRLSRYATYEDAEKDAREVAKAEGIEFIGQLRSDGLRPLHKS